MIFLNGSYQISWKPLSLFLFIKLGTIPWELEENEGKKIFLK